MTNRVYPHDIREREFIAYVMFPAMALVIRRPTRFHFLKSKSFLSSLKRLASCYTTYTQFIYIVAQTLLSDRVYLKSRFLCIMIKHPVFVAFTLLTASYSFPSVARISTSLNFFLPLSLLADMTLFQAKCNVSGTRLHPSMHYKSLFLIYIKHYCWNHGNRVVISWAA